MNAIDKFGAYRKAVELFDRVVEDLAPLREDFSLGRLISRTDRQRRFHLR